MRIRLMLLALISGTAVAAGNLPEQTYQDWTAGGSSDDQITTFAVTVNVDGDALGEFCYKNTHQCEWRYSSKIVCSNDEKGFVLINSDNLFNGSATTCLGTLIKSKPNEYVRRIENWRAVEDVLTSEGATTLGICIPLQNTQFQVSRWSVRGAVPATAYMGGPIVGERHSVGEAHNTSSGTNTSSETL